MNRPDVPAGSGFLSRWSRLKQETKNAEPVELPPESSDEKKLAEPTTGLPGKTAEPPPLPSLDDITPGADVAAFFQKHVPEALRTAALRKLWVTDPEIKGFIEMADYQWDFNNPDSIPGWSSKLENVDVKAMMERIFNVQPSAKLAGDEDLGRDTTSGPITDEVPKPADANDESISISTSSSIDSMTSATLDRSIKRVGEFDVAAQENTSESRGYIALRKRHGGALPT